MGWEIVTSELNGLGLPCIVDQSYIDTWVANGFREVKFNGEVFSFPASNFYRDYFNYSGLDITSGNIRIKWSSNWGTFEFYYNDEQLYFHNTSYFRLANGFIISEDTREAIPLRIMGSHPNDHAWWFKDTAPNYFSKRDKLYLALKELMVSPITPHILYGDSNGIGRDLNRIWYGDENGIARWVKKVMYGDANGIARLCYEDTDPPTPPLYPVDAETLEYAEMCWDYSKYTTKYGSPNQPLSDVMDLAPQGVSFLERYTGTSYDDVMMCKYPLMLFFNTSDNSITIYYYNNGWNQINKLSVVGYQSGALIYIMYSNRTINGSSLPRTNSQYWYSNAYYGTSPYPLGEPNLNDNYSFAYNLGGATNNLKELLKRMVSCCHRIRVYAGTSLESALPIMVYPELT